MAFKFSNGAEAILLSPISVVDTVIILVPAEAANFNQTVAEDDPQRCIIQDDTSLFEIVDVVGINADQLTLVRGLENSGQYNWPAGAKISQYLSQAVLEAFSQT